MSELDAAKHREVVQSLSYKLQRTKTWAKQGVKQPHLMKVKEKAAANATNRVCIGGGNRTRFAGEIITSHENSSR